VSDPEIELAGSAPGVFRASATISLVNAAARTLGFARWIVFGLTIGLTFLGNTYQTANLVPSIVFELVVGGVLSAVLVPTFVAELARGRRRAEEVTSTIANLFLFVSVPLVVGGMLGAPWIMRAMTIGVRDPVVRAEQVVTGAFFLRVFLPQIPLYLLAVLMKGVLHAHRRFALAAAAPAFQSVIVIATYLTFHALGPGADLATVSRMQLWVLAGGTTLGVAAWSLCMVPAVVRLGIRWRPVLHIRDSAVRRALRAGVYGLAFFCVTQVGLVVTLVLANRVEGGVAAFQIAFAFFELPNAVAGFPFAVALFPSLAQRALEGDEDGFARLLSRGWRAVAFLLAPAAVGLTVVARPLITVLFERAPTGASPVIVAAALAALAFGLPAYALNQQLIRAFYARHEPRAPVGLNAVTVGICVLAAVGLTVWLDPRGPGAIAVLGGAHAAGQWAGLAVGTVLLASRARAWDGGRDGRFLAGSLVRATLMGAAAFGVLRAASGGGRVLGVAAAAATGVIVYGALSARRPELGDAIRALRGQIVRKSPSTSDATRSQE